MFRTGKPYIQPGDVTDAITEDALGFIERHGRGLAAFYLSVHYPAPLASRDGHPQESLDLFANCAFDAIPREPIHPWAVGDLTAEPGSPRWRAQIQRYFASITAMDAGIGRILDRLDALGLAEETIVWFLADHGFNAGHHGVWGAGNGTFPLNLFDTSLRVPAIVRQPGVIPAGVAREEMLGAYDFAPTVLEQVGQAMPHRDRLPGRSFACLLNPEGGPDRDHVVVMAEYGPVRMIHTPAWKYVHRFPYGPHELYDMSHDPGERRNLMDDPATREIVPLLRGEMQRWFSRYGDPAVDGAHEQVTGSGQFLCAGTCNDGALPYDQSRRIAREAKATIPTGPDAT
jgi:arylsulfatase A-like enzyme